MSPPKVPAKDGADVETQDGQAGSPGGFRGPASAAHADADVLPRKLGRYVLMEKVGQGGMGAVYRAHDPQLDRTMAIKLLRPDTEVADDGMRSTRELRLLREAQALARLSHPNVVAVHDAGTEFGQVYVVMEFVPGQNLAQWLREAPRLATEVIDVFVQAGKGLAAAHSRGVVHRDFKPSNVFVGQDGRVRVGDFGLARVEGPRPSSDRAVAGVAWPAEMPLTGEGVAMGTVAYMAPEQMLGQTVDARADQYSFCVALHEALWAERPTLAQGLMGLEGVKRTDLVRARGIPGHIRKTLARGFRINPAERHASMDVLLAALEGRRTTARWLVLTVGVVLAMGSLATAAVMGWRTGQGKEQGAHTPVASQTCMVAAERMASAWGTPVRTRLVNQVVAPAGVAAQQAFSRVTANVDALVLDWHSRLDAACSATAAGNAQAHAQLGCLEGHALRIAHWVTQLEGAAGPEALAEVLATAAGWPAKASCESLMEAPTAVAAVPALLPKTLQAPEASAPSPATKRGQRRGRTKTPRSAGQASPTGQGTVTLQSTPWARIIVDGKDTGLYTPQNRMVLNAGRHKITLTNDTLNKSVNFSVSIRAGAHAQPSAVVLR